MFFVKQINWYYSIFMQIYYQVCEVCPSAGMSTRRHQSKDRYAVCTVWGLIMSNHFPWIRCGTVCYSTVYKVTLRYVRLRYLQWCGFGLIESGSGYKLSWRFFLKEFMSLNWAFYWEIVKFYNFFRVVLLEIHFRTRTVRVWNYFSRIVHARCKNIEYGRV